MEKKPVKYILEIPVLFDWFLFCLNNDFYIIFHYQKNKTSQNISYFLKKRDFFKIREYTERNERRKP